MSKAYDRQSKLLFHSLWVIPAIAWSALFLVTMGSGQSFQSYIAGHPQTVIIMSPTFLMLVWLFIFKSIKEFGTFDQYKKTVLWLSFSQLVMGNFVTAILGFMTWKKEMAPADFDNRSVQKGINIAISILVILSVFYVMILRRLLID